MKPAKAKSRPLRCHYSGKQSVEFWEKIESATQAHWQEAYSLGCALQTFEEVVLKRLKQLGVT